MKANDIQQRDYIADLLSKMESSAGDYTRARSLPSELYTSPTFFEFEKEAIFFKNWLALGHKNQIPNPGDYFTVEVVDEPLIIIRQKDMSIKVLSAICQHRGHPLVFDCADEKTGNINTLTCPYHAWSYQIDGQLRGAPSMSKTVPLTEQRSDTRLPELKVELFHGFIFANFDLDAAPLAPTLARADAELKNYDFENMEVMPTQIHADYPWNWKISLENGLEPYHTSYVHRGFHEVAPAENARFTDYDDYTPGENYLTHITYFENMRADAAFNPTGFAQFPILEKLTEEERKRTVFSAVPPTLFFCLLPDQAFTFRVFPRSADRLDLFVNFYYPKETTQLPKFDWMRSVQVSSTGTFGEQDELTNKTMQKAFKSRFAPRGRYSHLEAILPEFNRWLLEKYKRAL
ncbi:aromatic ring-hydroxylating dioxygenase subunit alpha [Pusillimonas sp.]|uniref:aromatic ring-hydroxylating dioxygenase subunit alpha n=1 Tax=Pusillimonas sp. TaxID=3040095 RepID=UPI0037C7ACBB